jgi:hypothetical protein
MDWSAAETQVRGDGKSKVVSVKASAATGAKKRKADETASADPGEKKKTRRGKASGVVKSKK